MPTSFTVVPVDDAEGGSHSSDAAGGSKPSTLGQLFREEQDGGSSPEALAGRVVGGTQAFTPGRSLFLGLVKRKGKAATKSL